MHVLRDVGTREVHDHFLPLLVTCVNGKSLDPEEAVQLLLKECILKLDVQEEACLRGVTLSSLLELHAFNSLRGLKLSKDSLRKLLA